MADADIYDALRALDADNRFKDCSLSLTRSPGTFGGHKLIQEIRVRPPSEADPELFAQLSAFAKHHGLDAKFEFGSLVLRLPE